MSFTSVILPCPDAIYVWFEERLTTGTIEQAMLAALMEWQSLQTAAHANEAPSGVGIAARLGSLFGELLAPVSSPPPSADSAPTPPAPQPPRRHTGGRRRGNRR